MGERLGELVAAGILLLNTPLLIQISDKGFSISVNDESQEEGRLRKPVPLPAMFP